MSGNYNQYPLADKYGIHRNMASRRLELMDLSDADHVLAKLLHTEVIKPNVTNIINKFYEFIFQHEEMRFYIKNESVLTALKNTQIEYLLTLGMDFDSPEYLEYRLRVGIAHDRINMPMRLYESAYAKLQNIIMAAIPESIRQDSERLFSLLEFLNKIIAFDMSLAVDVYYLSRISDMSKSIDHLIHVRDTLTAKVEQDVLTSAYSRRYILEFLRHKLAELRRDSRRPFCIAMLDLDHFKKINDTYGHVIGDHVLQKIVAFVMSEIREVDQLGRYGGEEFLLILPNVKIDGASAITERIRKAIAETVITVEKQSIKVTISIGVCQAKVDDTPESIIERADKALYEAKNSGRDQVRICES